MIKLNDYTYLFPFEEERDRPNIGYIKGSNKSLLIDFGFSKMHLEEVISDLNKEGLKYPDLGVLTHYHFDHSLGLNYFKGISISSKRSNDYLKLFSKMKLNNNFLKSYLSGSELNKYYDAICKEYNGDFETLKVRTTDIEFNEYLKINLGDIDVELFHLYSPHSDDAVYVKVNDILFIGDSFFYNQFDGETKFNKEKLTAFLMVIDSFDVQYIVEGHSKYKTKKELEEEIKQLL